MVWPSHHLPVLVRMLSTCESRGSRAHWASTTMALALVVSCKSDQRDALPEASSSPNESAGPAPLSPTRPAPTYSATCLLMGADEVERSDNLTNIGYFYGMGLRESCVTSRLTQALSEDQFIDWIGYLINYSSAIFECGLAFSPLPGGIDQFGLSNTDVVGVPSPMLGADDADALVNLYLAVCSEQLGIDPGALVQVRSQLERSAANRVDPSISAQLSECPSP